MNAKEFISEISPERCEEVEFRRLALEFAEALSFYNIKVTPYRAHAKMHFNKCSLKKKREVIAYLDLNISLIKECIRAGETPSNKTLLWRLLQKTRLVPDDEIFDKISDGDLVEVYFTDHTPMFRSLEFYRDFTFTVDEALCLRWYQLCKRDFVITLKFMKFIFLGLRGNNPKTQVIPIGEHYLDEKNTERKLRFLVHNKYLSGLMKNGSIHAGICVTRVRPVGEKMQLWK
nr:hypothetical protein BHI3_19280 [Bacteriovorax sp. HI3]